MGKAAHTVEADFIVSTGDNFYPSGVASVQDPLWKRSFEDVYTAFSLQEEWYPVLGNHDYDGDAQAQIEYSRISRRWRRFVMRSWRTGRMRRRLCRRRV
jgi:hypothetical protein